MSDQFAGDEALWQPDDAEDLFATLKRMGIDRLRSETFDATAWVAGRVIDPAAESVEVQHEDNARPAARGHR